MDEYTSSGQVWELVCPRLPQEVGRARRWTRDILSDHPAVEDAALIVTELGANAVRHTAGNVFRLTISRAGQAVTLTVKDTGPAVTSPHITLPDRSATDGRGLSIVATLAAELSVTHHASGCMVTVRLPHKPSEAPEEKTQPC
ncbi:ATP-binding protein [Streptomyces sp. NPDC053560]|uniref:ATP-binding protein n=1 Tax=Streptomyces sp. NPDC053560 TaxID=3365711 RepID=UPI0037D83C52